jgi:DNA polymerase-3 subunit epsilon
MVSDEFEFLPVDKADFCVVDVETTGLSPRFNNVIEIGIVRVSRLKIVDKYHSLINPGRAVPYYITSFTGISNDDIYNAPFFEDIVEDLVKYFSGSIIAGHNLSFDRAFLRKEFEFCGKEKLGNPHLCTHNLARRLYPMLKSKSLSSICRHLHVMNYRKHRALEDAEATARILIKMLIELKIKHKIKNVGELISFQYLPKERKILRINKKLAADVASLPDAPGIYSFLNSRGKIIYIGKAKSLRSRVRSYFLTTAPKKAKRIIKQTARIKTEITNSELTALLKEAESIKIKNPRHNSLLKKYGSKYFLRVIQTHASPRIEICNYFDFDGNDYFGLFISKKKALLIHEMISKTFELRECDDTEFLKGKSCFLADIGRCLAPCIATEKESYNKELEKVYEFLYGKNQFALNRLLHKMKFYSEKQKYEKAAEVKQLIDLILSQTHKSSLLAEPVNSANVLFEISERFGKDFILMLSGKIYVKQSSYDTSDGFDEALDDYFNKTINTRIMPEEEDLEKMKITLNWLIKNRNKVRALYLKDFNNKEELNISMSNSGVAYNNSESVFDVKNYFDEESIPTE